MTSAEFFAARAIDPVLAANLGVRVAGNRVEYPNGRTRLFTGKTLQPKGVPLTPWFLTAPKEDSFLLLCEGETDALAAFSHLKADSKVCVVCIPGASTPARTLHLGAHQSVVFLAFDGDPAGYQATNKFAEHIRLEGGWPMKVPIAPGSDLAAHLVDGGRAELVRLLANAVTLL